MKSHTETTSHFDATVLDALYEHIAIIDLSGEIIFINRTWKDFAHANGYNASHCGLGENYLNIVLGTEVETGIRTVIEGHTQCYSYEYTCHSPTENRWFWLYVTPLINRNKQITGAVTSHINMTERKIAELQVEALQKQLLQSERNKVLVETAGATAHEINQPLTAVLGLSEILTRRTDLPTDVAEDIQLIFESSQHINRIIKKMQQAETYTSKSYIDKTNIVDFEASHTQNPEKD